MDRCTGRRTITNFVKVVLNIKFEIIHLRDLPSWGLDKWHFRFKAEEDESVTDEIGDILLDYLERTLYAKGVSFDEDMLDAVEWEVFSKMVDGVIDYVDDQVIPDLENYISIMTKRETGAFLKMFDFLGKLSLAT